MDIEQSETLMKNFISLREKAKETKEEIDIKKFRAYERLCIEKFKYLIMMKTSRYKNFNNYEDLVQEGLEALTKAMKNYDPKKGMFFWWLHKYVDTRISRSANLHTTIRFPLKYTKTVIPYREPLLPILYDMSESQFDTLQKVESASLVQKNLKTLPDEQFKVTQLFFGLNGLEPQSISKVCKALKITRPTATKLLEEAMGTLKDTIQL